MKMAKFVPCHETIMAEGTAELFLLYIFKEYGIPEQLITERGSQFASKMFRALFRALGIVPSLSTAYHPQTDGQTERANQELEQFL